MPYVEGEVPDVMVQLSVVQALHEYGMWRGDPVPLAQTLMKGVARFYDSQGQDAAAVPARRRRGAEGQRRDRFVVPLPPAAQSRRLALRGSEEARDLLLKAIDYGIESAHHFDYAWPIKYHIDDFSVIEKARGTSVSGRPTSAGSTLTSCCNASS
jgi:hypothetical protein